MNYNISNKRQLLNSLQKKYKKARGQSLWTEFEGHYNSYKSAANICGEDCPITGGGYSDEKIFDRVAKSALEVKKGNACYERDGILFYENNYNLQIISIFLMVYCNKQKLNIVDFGGSLGSMYFQNRKLLNDANIKYQWNICEQPHFVQLGKKQFEDGVLFFRNSLDEVKDYNIIMFAVSIQYIENYLDIFNKVIEDNTEYIVFDRLTVCDEEFYCVQKVYEPIYEAEYPVHIFDEEEFKKFFYSKGYELQCEWIMEENGYFCVKNKKIWQKSYFFKKM